MSELTACNYDNLQRLIDRYEKQNVKIVADGEWLHVLVREGACTCKWRNMPDDFELHREPCKRAWKDSGHHFLALSLVCVC